MDLTSIDIKNLVLELKSLEGGKIQKVYQNETFELILDLYSKTLPRFFYLQLPSKILFKEKKVEMPKTPLSLAKRLRSHITNARIKNVEQINNDRIIKFFLEGKNQNYTLILELFSKGNIILLNKNEKIIVILKQETFKDRILKPGKIYSPPKNRIEIQQDIKITLKKLLEENKEKHVISIISSLGLGGKYSEKILKKLYEKNYKTIKSEEAIKKTKKLEELYKIIEEYYNSKKYYVGKEDVYIYNKLLEEEKELYDNIILALKNIPLEEKKGTNTKVNEKKEEKKKDKKIVIQKKRVEELQKKSIEYEEKGKKIFENYVLLKEVLDYAKNYKEKKGNIKKILEEWPENFPKIKKINEKENKITIILE